MRILGEETRRAVRHRPVQAFALALLAAAATLLSTLAPLYSVAMAQAVSHLDVRHAPVLTTALQLVSQPSTDDSGRTVAALSPADLAVLPPASLRRSYEKPTLSRSGQADVPPYNLTGQVEWLVDSCAHVTILRGRCPQQAGEIIVSEADLRLASIRVGASIPVPGVTIETGVPALVNLRVVGAYRIKRSAYWDLHYPVGMSGLPSGRQIGHDDWLTVESTFTSMSPTLQGMSSTAIFRLRASGADVHNLLAIPGQFARFDDRVRADQSRGEVSATSNIGDIVADIHTQQEQADRIVPLLMLQLVLLTLVVFWQVLGAAMDQRRPDVALARLRGRGRRATTRLLLGELLPVVEAGVVVGAAGGIAAAALVRKTLLPTAPFDLPRAYWLAFVAAAVCIAGLTVLAARGLARQPVDRLLRRVPPRHRWQWTVLDTVLVTLATAGVIAFAVGGLGRDFALAGPALVALLAGLLLGHAVTPAAALIGRRALSKGRVVRGLAALEAARRPGARRTITMLTLSAAFLVFFGNAWSVGVTNRQSVAEQVIGAPRVLTTTTLNFADVQKALATVDPRGRRATAVTVVRPLGGSTAPSTLAVDPAAFPRIALLGAAARELPWSRLVPDTAPPVRVAGDHLTFSVDSSRLPQRAGSLAIGLRLLKTDGTTAVVAFGNVHHSAGSPTLSSLVPCAGGCTVLGVTVGTSPGANWSGSLTLGPIRGDSTTEWGTAANWPTVRPALGASIRATSATAAGLTVRVVTGGSSSFILASAWMPTTVPAFASGPGTTGADPSVLGVDRQLRPTDIVARAPHLPTADRSSLVVDLDALARGALLDPSNQVQVWLSDADRQFDRLVSKALADHGVTVVEDTTVAAQRSTYDDSVAAWSLTLALIIGVITLLIALLAMVVLAVTGWRTTARDLAALQLNGLPRRQLLRATLLAQTATVLVAVLVGTGAGILACWLAIDQVPLFAHQPPLTTLDLTPAWAVIGGTALATLVVLLAAARLLARRVAARAQFDRLSEAS